MGRYGDKIKLKGKNRMFQGGMMAEKKRSIKVEDGIYWLGYYDNKETLNFSLAEGAKPACLKLLRGGQLADAVQFTIRPSH